jgi:hypothetical protein
MQQAAAKQQIHQPRRQRQTATLRAAVSYLKTRAQEDASNGGASGTESAGGASWLSGSCPFVIATAQPCAIQKRLASTNEEKKHQNVHGVAVAANGAPKNSHLYQEKPIERNSGQRCSWEKRAGSAWRSNMRSAFVPEIN